MVRYQRKLTWEKKHKTVVIVTVGLLSIISGRSLENNTGEKNGNAATVTNIVYSE